MSKHKSEDGDEFYTKQEKFFSKFSRGQWKGILTPKIYQRVRDWCADHDPDNPVVFRFLFLDDEREKPLPIYVLANPYFEGGRIKINTVHLPKESDIDDRSENELLALPKWVKNMALFCVPDNALVGLD